MRGKKTQCIFFFHFHILGSKTLDDCLAFCPELLLVLVHRKLLASLLQLTGGGILAKARGDSSDLWLALN